MKKRKPLTRNRIDQYFLIRWRELEGSWLYYNTAPYHILIKAHKNYNRVIKNHNSLYNTIFERRK